MPITTLEGRLREVCRIRMGVKMPPTKPDGKPYPKATNAFRITSRSRDLVEQAAELWGGEVEEWHDKAIVEPQWQVTTEAKALPCLIPPAVNTFSQWYELWTEGGCQRRCTGKVDVIVDEPCRCPVDPEEKAALAARGEACKPTTRLSVMLPQLAEFGVARLESHGYYAAVELAGAAALYEAATAGGQWMPAELRLERRTIRRPGQPPKHFVVPALAIRTTLGESLEALGLVTAGGLLSGPGRAVGAGRTAAGELGTGAPPPDEDDGDIIDAEGEEIEGGYDDEPFHPTEPRPLAELVPDDREQWGRVAVERATQAGVSPAVLLEVTKLITKGRTTHHDQLSDVEWLVYWQVIDRIGQGLMTVTQNPDDITMPRWRFCDNVGRPLRLTWDDQATISAELTSTAHYRDASDWKEALRGSGVAQAGLLRQARAIAADLGKREPQKLEDLVDVDVASRLATWLDDRKTSRRGQVA